MKIMRRIKEQQDNTNIQDPTKLAFMKFSYLICCYYHRFSSHRVLITQAQKKKKIFDVVGYFLYI